jgi:hypothetical protein
MLRRSCWEKCFILIAYFSMKFAITSVATVLCLIALVLEDVRGSYGRKVSELAVSFSGKVESRRAKRRKFREKTKS